MVVSSKPTSVAQHQHSVAGAHTVYAIASGVALLEKETPQSYQEAVSGKEAKEWKKAMKEEFDGCVAANTWEVIPRASLPSGTNVIPVKWVFKKKPNVLGKLEKFKARITPKGFKQKYGEDYFEVFANTGKYKTLRIALSIAASRDLELKQLDVPQAFIQADLEEDVYMEMPQGFEQPDMVCYLKKSLYGLKQSPRNWYLLASDFLVNTLAFIATVSDPCLFYKKSRTGQLMLLFLFVDDMQVAFDKEDTDEWSADHQQLKDRFNIKDLGDSEFMLGMKITRDRKAKTITLDQELYITKALEKFGLDQCKPVSTPGDSDENINMDEDSEVKKKKDEPTDLKLYQEKLGTLMYASIATRFDISYKLNKLAQKLAEPTVRDAKELDRVFKYLAGTKSMGLLFGRRNDSTSVVTAYADADWAKDQIDRKSVTGWIAMVNGDPVSWASKKQKVVSQSSCEAELYAEAAAINETKWLSGLLGEIGLIENESASVPIIYGDNQSTQTLTKNGIKSERTKHVAIKYAYIHDEVFHKRVKLEWVPSNEQLADIMTKCLPRPLHEALRSRLMINASDMVRTLSTNSA